MTIANLIERLRSAQRAWAKALFSELFGQAADALASSQEEVERLTRERQLLAEAIAEAAHKAGIYNGEVPLTGPHLLLLADDLAEYALASKAGAA